MSLLPAEVFAPIFEPLRGKRIGYVQGQYGNAGDALIHHATLQLFAAFVIEYRILNERDWRASKDVPAAPEVDELVLFGGGSMGARMSGSLRALARTLKLPTTLLPQSWRAPEDAPYARVFARERFSLRYCPEAILLPDLALAYEVTSPAVELVEEGGLFLRKDEEGLFRTHRSMADPARGWVHEMRRLTSPGRNATVRS